MPKQQKINQTKIAEYLIRTKKMIQLKSTKGRQHLGKKKEKEIKQ